MKGTQEALTTKKLSPHIQKDKLKKLYGITQQELNVGGILKPIVNAIAIRDI